MAIVLVVCAISGYRWWFSEERAVKARLAEIAQTLSVSPSDGDLSRVARAARLRGFLADDMILRAGSQEVASRDAIVGLVGRWSPPGAVTVEFVDARVRFDESSREVVYVHLTVKVSANDPRTGEPTIDAREADVQLEQRNGQWVVAQATTVDTLAR